MCCRDGPLRAICLSALAYVSQTQLLLPGLAIQHSFSDKPAAGYRDYYEKMTRYIDIVSSPAKSMNPNVDARTFKPIESDSVDSVFRYVDTPSSRAGISMIATRPNGMRVAIVGLGGSGSYILDFVAKTGVKEIYLFDDDLVHQHTRSIV